MKQIILIVGLSLLVAHIAWGADWEFTDALDDWEATGWQEFNYTGGGNPDGKLIQNDDGTVTVVDPSNTANFYMMRILDWDVPYTVQLRVKVDSIAGQGSGQYPVISSYVVGKISIQPVMHHDAISDWPVNNIFEVNMEEFQILTIVARMDGSADIYVNDNFDAPALVVPVGATTFYPETRLEIGAPTGAVATITVDYVALGQGEILEIWAGGLAVEPYDRLSVLWGNLRK